MAKNRKSSGGGIQLTFGDVRATSGGGEIIEADITTVFPNPDQPRKVFDDASLYELASSIAAHGIISPIIVVPSGEGYMIIAGERRWRAANIAGKKTVPVIVKNMGDKQIKEVSLIENLQREDLNPIEAANAMKQLMEEYGMTQEVLAERLGKSRSTVANTLRLLQLTPDVIRLISEGRLSAGHARALITLPDSEQLTTAMKAINDGLSVREVEQKVRDYFNPPEIVRKERQEKLMRQSVELRDLVSRMQRALATKVSAIGNDFKGRIYIDYYTRDDLDRLCDFIALVEDKQRRE